MSDNENTVLYWLGRLSGHLFRFEAAPGQDTKAELLMALGEYQKAVAEGLPPLGMLPPPVRNTRNFAEWYRQQLEEALAMFRVNPSNDRLGRMTEHLNGYLDAVAAGRVRLPQRHSALT